MNTYLKNLLTVAIFAGAVTTRLPAETVVYTITNNQTQSVTITIPYCADIDVHGTAYGPPSSYITGTTPIGGFYYTPSNGSLHMTGTVQAGTYTIYENVGSSGYLCVMVMYHPGPYSLSSTTQATSPSDRQRKKIGVGEVVTVTLDPAPSSTAWSTPYGVGHLSDANPGYVTFTAPDTPQDVTVQATTSDGYSYVRTFNVVAPSAGYMERDEGAGVYHEYGLPSAGMFTYIYVQPADVNFSAIEIREETCVATATGYFSPLNGSTATHSQGSWVPLSPHTSGKGTGPTDINIRDKVVTSGASAWTYAAGTFLWPIPWSYRIKGKTSVYSFAVVNHGATSYSSGTLSIFKAGAGYSANLYDSSGEWYP